MRARRVTAWFVALGSMSSAVAWAATRTWSATPVSGNWSVGANWAGGVPPGPGDDLVFPASSTILSTTNDLAAGIAIHSIVFNGNGYRLAGNAITIMATPAGTEVDCASGAPPGIDIISLPIIDVLPPDSTLAQVAAVEGCTLTLSGAISGDGGLATGGGGTIVLSGENTYAQTTALSTIGAGITLVNGTLATSQMSTGILTHSALGGSGSILNTVLILFLGKLRPGQGASTGILSTGNLQIDSSSSLFLKLNGPTVGIQYDQVSVSGTVSVAGFLSVSSLGFVPANGTQFTIIENDGADPISGTFALLSEGGTFTTNNTTFQISYVGGNGNDVVLTVISPWVPTALAVDTAGNGVLEPGEAVNLKPTWTNSSGASSSLSGATTNFTGPAGPTYSDLDATGSYGTLADGASEQCTDCYSVEVTGARPAAHWDATIDETINPTAALETWKLHVGGSFPDVPTSQPFYSFIENLFHNGITGGCGGGSYCPAGSTTRGQMAVFLLRAKHGSGYVPPACNGTFPDVPCPSQFADWIEQLAIEGITGGCGGGNYCPGNPVTRAQMAVFLLKSKHGSSYVPPVCAGTFDDVTCPSQFADWIEQLSAESITGGCGGDNYCPTNPNTRGQMAVFLVRTFGLRLYGP